MQKLELSQICERIALRTPYFSFSDMEAGNGSIQARLYAEHEIGFERGPIATAEIVRHLATLGACAAVVEGPAPKTYYLGTKGRLRVLRPAGRQKEQKEFRARSEIINRDKRRLVAHSTISNGDFLAHFHCEYQVIPESVFSRTFKDYRDIDCVDPANSPYTIPVELEFDVVDGLTLTARSLPLPPSRFAGHFEEYPSWPASVYAEAASRAVGKLLHHIVGEEVQYNCVRMDIDALRLISSSDSLSFDVHCISASRSLSHYVFSVSVRQEDVVASAIEIEAFC